MGESNPQWICPGCGAREIDILLELRELAEDGQSPICPACRIRMIRALPSPDGPAPP